MPVLVMAATVLSCVTADTRRVSAARRFTAL
jgi:hypothetical protein